MLITGLVTMVASAIVAVTRVDVPAFLEAPTAAVPGTLTVELAEGRQVIYLAQPTLGSSSLDATDVSVTGPTGEVAVSEFRLNEEMERGRTEYRGVLSFDVLQAGSYEIVVTGVEPGEILVSPSIVDTFRDVALPAAVAVIGFVILGVGLVLMIVGLVLRSQQPRPIEGVSGQ